MSFRFLHAADIHLDSPLRGLERYEGAPVEDIRNAPRRAFENLIRLAIDSRVDFVVLAGDVYDGDWKDHNTGLFFVKQMNRLRAAGIPAIMIAGNHDAENKMTKSLTLPDNVEFLSSQRPQTATCPRLEELGVAVHGRSFATAAETENLVRSYPARIPGRFNIGLLHTSLEGAVGHEPYAPCTIDDLRQKGYDYWALGHVHQRQIVCREPWVVFSGNIQGRQVRETGAKGCYLVDVNDRGDVNPTFRPLDVVRWEVCRIEITNVARPEELIGLLEDALAALRRQHGDLTMAVRVIVAGSSPCHAALMADPMRWTNDFRSAAQSGTLGNVWLETVQWQATAAAWEMANMPSDGPLGELVSLLRELRDDEVQLKELAEEFNDLRRKLPDELMRGAESLGLDDPDRLRQWLDDVQPLILSRLIGGRK